MFDVLAKACDKLTELTKDKVKAETDGVTGECTVEMALGKVSAHAKWADRGSTSWKDFSQVCLDQLDVANAKLKEAGKRPVVKPNVDEYTTKTPYATIQFTSQALKGPVGQALTAAIEVVTAALIQEGLSDNELAKLGISAETVAKARKTTPVKVQPA